MPDYRMYVTKADCNLRRTATMAALGVFAGLSDTARGAMIDGFKKKFEGSTFQSFVHVGNVRLSNRQAEVASLRTFLTPIELTVKTVDDIGLSSLRPKLKHPGTVSGRVSAKRPNKP